MYNYSSTKANNSNKSKYWQNQRKIDNRSKVLPGQSVASNASKYHYKKSSTSIKMPPFTSVNGILPSERSVTQLADNSLKMTVRGTPAKLLPVPPNVYINPHFKLSQSRPLNLQQNANAHYVPLNKTTASLNQYGSNSNPVQTFNNTSSVPKTSVHVNPSVFNSDQAFSIPSLLNSASTLPTSSSVRTALEQKPADATRSVHVNPVVLSTHDNLPLSAGNAMKSVHVNPKVFARLKSEVRREKPCPKPATPSTLETPCNRSLVAISRTKLIRSRKLSYVRSPHDQCAVTPKSRLLSITKYTASPLTKIVRSVRSKYKYIRKSSASTAKHLRPYRRSSPLVKTQFKLDRRQQKTPNRLKNVHKYSLKYENSQDKPLESNLQGIMQYKRLSSSSKSPFGNRVLRNMQSLQPKRVIITDRKLLKIGSTPTVKKNNVNRRMPRTAVGSTLVRIGGILYKTSRTQLTRTNGLTPKSMTNVLLKTPVVKKSRYGAGHVVHVRGNKFLMDRSGKTLRRFSNEDVPTGRLKRVDIGGATFIQKTPNVLIRSNNHSIRTMLSHVKQKSIAVLSKHMRKNNTLCKFYRRFGRCFRNEKGRCPCVHDRKYVAICKSFLLGKCKNACCLLSHELIPEKMPTCKYFLQATCARDVCPYLHVKLNAKAPLCVGFLQGYCNEGINCRKWHFNICPQFDKIGKCSKGKYCPFPHKPRKHMELAVAHLVVNVGNIMKMYKDRIKAQRERKPEKIIRYFSLGQKASLPENGDADADSGGVKETVDFTNPSSSTSSDDNEGGFVMKRCKIGFLPSFIPLN